MREKQGPFASRRNNAKNWRLITDDYGNESWWFRCSKCSGWRVIPLDKKPTVYYCPPCHRRDKRERYRQLQANRARHMEVLETRRIRYYDHKTSQGLVVNPKLGQHRLKYAIENPGMELLPAGPIQAFIRERIASQSIVDFAEVCGLPERSINRILNKNTQFTTFELVDKILTEEGTTLIWDLYPNEYEELLAA